ncbi:hypothetical protein ABZ721_10410 [Streptomyces sp. NPDC006733]|uniref:hypothetical protein n=1 Tax=Streptomyces sp. NPDC006733 TaxID=3155460 RepID=UPI0033DED1AF
MPRYTKRSAARRLSTRHLTLPHGQEPSHHHEAHGHSHGLFGHHHLGTATDPKKGDLIGIGIVLVVCYGLGMAATLAAGLFLLKLRDGSRP